MRHANKKIDRRLAIFRNYLAFSLGILLIGCGGSSSTDSNSGDRLAAALTLTRDVPMPKNLIHEKEAQFAYTFANNNITPLLVAANGASYPKITSIVFPPGSILDSVSEACTGKVLNLGESCPYSGELSSASSVTGGITVNYTQDGQQTSQRFPLNIQRLSKEQIENKLSVPGKIVFLKDNAVQIQINNDSEVALNNVSIHLDSLDSEFVNNLDFNSIKGGKYDKKDNEISMEENLPAGQTHTFTFNLKAMDQTQFLKLAKTMFNQQATFKIGAANAKIIEKPIVFSLNKNVLFIGISGVNSMLLDELINNKDFLEKTYPALSQMINNGYQYWNLYAGGTYGEDSQQPTDDAPGFTTLLTGVWANKHGVTSDDNLFNEQYRGVPTIYNTLLSEFPYTDAHMITSRTFLADLAKFGNNNLPGVPAENVINLDEGKYDSETVARLDSVVIDKLIELLKQKEANSTSFYAIYQGLPDASVHQDIADKTSTYREALRQTLSNIDTLLSQIDLQNWLVIMSADHGFVATDNRSSHGSQNFQNRQIFAFLSDSAIYKKDHQLPETLQGQTAIVPTILHYFGLPIPNSLDSSYIGDHTLKSKLFYLKASTLKDSGLIFSVTMPPKSMRHWSGMSVKDAEKITGVVNSDNYYYFFLNDGQYLSYNVKLGSLDQNKQSTSKYWDGIIEEDAKQISAVVKNDNYFYFFLNDGRCLRYNPLENKVDLIVGIANYFQGVSAENAQKISGASSKGLDDRYSVVFLNDGRIMGYDISKRKLIPWGIPETSFLFLGMKPYGKNIIAALFDEKSEEPAKLKLETYFFISMKNDLYR